MSDQLADYQNFVQSLQASGQNNNQGTLGDIQKISQALTANNQGGFQDSDISKIGQALVQNPSQILSLANTGGLGPWNMAAGLAAIRQAGGVGGAAGATAGGGGPSAPGNNSPFPGAARALSFGPGNFPGADKPTHAVMYGALTDANGQQVKMGTSDIAMSPGRMKAEGYKLGDYVDLVNKNGDVVYPNQRIADYSYVKPGQPTTNSIELWGRPDMGYLGVRRAMR